MTFSRSLASLMLVTIVAAGGSAVARDQTDTREPRATGPQEAEVLGVAVDRETQAPAAVVLEGKRDHRRVAMAIDPAQVTAIAVPLHGLTPPRPLTHDLFITLFGRLNVTLSRVVITDLRDDVYYANVYLASGSTEIVLDSRPSDAIALAIRARVPVLVEDRVFDKAKPAPEPDRSRI
jgi:uncharacterized protein